MAPRFVMFVWRVRPDCGVRREHTNYFGVLVDEAAQYCSCAHHTGLTSGWYGINEADPKRRLVGPCENEEEVRKKLLVQY